MLGIGTALPEHTMTLDEATQLSSELVARDDRERRLVRTMFRKAGVLKRHICVPHTLAYDWVGPNSPPSSHPGETTAARMQIYSEHAPPLAAEASRQALTAASVQPSKITHLVTASCTGFDAPGVDIELIERLGLPATTQRLHIGYMGCHAAINALRAARGLAASDPTARILICAVELCGLHFQFQWDIELILGNALFADGAAAIVAGGDDAAGAASCTVKDTGSCIVAGSKDAMSWRVGDHGFLMSISNRVPDLIRDNLRNWLSAWLDSQGHSIDSVGSWAVHAGGPRILTAVEQALELDSSALSTSREVLAECGNMSSPTVVFVVDRFLQRNAPRPYVMLGFGPGLMVEAALIE